jgi:antitoxin HigA-1
MIRSLRDRATERLWMAAFVKQFSGIEKQALRNSTWSTTPATSATCARRRQAGSKRWQETAAGSSQFVSTINGASVLLGPRRVRPMSKSSTTTKRAAPNRVTTHPGEVLSEEFLDPLGMSANALAMALRVPATRIGAIVKGERSVTADTALRLARFFGTSPEFWMNLQAMHDLTKARLENGKTIKRDIRPRAA